MQRLRTETSRSYLGRSAARAVAEVERKVAGLSQSQSTSAGAGCHASWAIESGSNVQQLKQRIGQQ
jgi:hypothetical protein